MNGLSARVFASLLLGALLAPTSAAAQGRTVWGRSSTYLGGYVKPADTEEATYLPFMEVVDLHTSRLGVDGLSLHTGFWGLIDIIDRRDRYRATGDLTTLYLDYRVPGQGRLRSLEGLRVTAGRQFVTLGPTVLEQVDGGKLHYIHRSGLEVGLFGGAPTGTHLLFEPWPADQDSYDYNYNWVLGGRLGYVNLGWLSAGTSFVHRRFDGRVADNDLGFDLSASPLSMLDLSGSGTLSLEANRLKELKTGVELQPWRPLSLLLGYRFYSPDLWVPRISIFAVFSEETYQEAHLDARWRATRRLSLDAGYGRRFYGGHDHEEDASAHEGSGESDGANRATLRAVYRLDASGPGRAMAEAERVESPDNAANRVRLALALPLYLLSRTFQIVVDLDLTVLDEELRGARVGFTGGAFIQAPLARQLTLLAGASGGVSPLLKQAGSFIIRLNWDFEWPSGDVAVTRGGGV